MGLGFPRERVKCPKGKGGADGRCDSSGRPDGHQTQITKGAFVPHLGQLRQRASSLEASLVCPAASA